MNVMLNGRPVIDIEVDGVDSTDYPDFCDSYFCNAYWGDTLEPLSEDELYLLQEEHCDLLWEMAYQSLV
jgi:hypothetical protein